MIDQEANRDAFQFEEWRFNLNFADREGSERDFYRKAVEDAQGLVEGYYGPCLQVCLPNPSGAFWEAMEAAGLEYEEGSLFNFPLGSDNPPDHLRHDGRYKGSKGFWLMAKFRPRFGA